MVQSCQKRRGKEQRDEVQDTLEACVREGAREMLAIASEEEVNGWDVEAIRAMQQNGSYYLPPEARQALSEVINSVEHQAYEALRDVAPELAGSLEAAQETIYIRTGTPTITWAVSW